MLILLIPINNKENKVIKKEEYIRNATVVKVIDGDTVDLLVDLGFELTYKTRCRLTGINAPEKNTPEGMKSAEWLTKLLPTGRAVIIKTDRDKKEKYGRYLATIQVAGLKDSVNQSLVDAGLAVPYIEKK